MKVSKLSAIKKFIYLDSEWVEESLDFTMIFIF